MTQKTGTSHHPYFPRTLSIPHYIPNDKPLLEILGVFFGIVAVVLVLTWAIAGKNTSIRDRLVLCWFVVCGFIHMILEGYFSLYHATLAGESTYLAQMWKEYGKGDSRYITSDTFMVCMESITAAVDGPLCFATAAALIKGSRYRYILQLIVSLCQLYGDSLYFLTEIKENFAHGEVGHPLHFWFYFVFLNMFWIIVPLIMIGQAVIRLSQSQALEDKQKPMKSSKKKR